MHKLFFILGFLLTNSIFAMQTEEKPPRPQVPAELSKEIVQFIMNSATLEDAIAAIKKYAIIDQKIEESPSITQFLIKEIAHKWFEQQYLGDDLIAAALALNTKGAQAWLASADAKKSVAEKPMFYEEEFAKKVKSEDPLDEKTLTYLKTLLNLGIDPNTPKSNWGTIPLKLAISNNKIPIVELLLKSKKVDPNHSIRNDWGTPLKYAISSGPYINTFEDRKKIIELLLNAGADVNYRMHFPNDTINALWEALRFASDDEQEKIIKLLLDAGADPYQQIEIDSDVTTPLAIAEQEAKKDKKFNRIVKLMKEAVQKQRKQAMAKRLKEKIIKK